MKKFITFFMAIAALGLAGCKTKAPTPTSKEEPPIVEPSESESTEPSEPSEPEPSEPEPSEPEPSEPEPSEPEEVVDPIIITDANLLSYTGTNIKYGDGTADINDITFNYEELGAYGNGMQMRTKDGKSSTIYNVDELPAALKQIKITIHEGKDGYANEHALNFYVGKDNKVEDATIVWDTEKDVAQYTLDVDAVDCTYFKMIHGTTYSLYIDSIELVF